MQRIGIINEQSRQLVTHGHITINDQKVTIPSYVVSEEEN